MSDAGPKKVYDHWMAFDFGIKRIGIAVGQRVTDQATPIDPIPARDGIPDWSALAAIIEEWQPHAFVTGLPLNMDGSDGPITQRARKFANRLEGRFHRPSFTHDERLTSYEAKGEVIAAGGNRNFGQNSVDGIAASLILESWFRQYNAEHNDA